jgi:hypothetical protein
MCVPLGEYSFFVQRELLNLFCLLLIGKAQMIDLLLVLVQLLYEPGTDNLEVKFLLPQVLN